MENRYILSPVPKERNREFVDFFYVEFFPREPMALASGLAENTNPDTIDSFVEWVNQDLSLAVIDSETDEIVAGVLNCTLNKSPSPFASDYSCMQPEDRCIWMFLDNLEKDCDLFAEMGTNSGMELLFLCVKSGFEKRGFARCLTEATIDLAKQRNFGFIKTNPTTPGNNDLLNTCELNRTLHLLQQRVIYLKPLDFKPGEK